MPKKSDLFLKEALIDMRLQASGELEPLLKESETSKISLRQLLIARGLLSEKDILTALAEKLGLRFIDLRSSSIDKTAIEKAPVKIATYYSLYR